MKKEDFSNPIDWIIYKVNGNKPQKQEYDLRFYPDTEDRCSVWHNKEYVCMCDKTEKDKVIREFNKTYNGRNIEEASKHLKSIFNKNTKKSRKPAKISFIKQNGTGRIHVRTRHNKKTINLCSCEASQTKEIRERYEKMRSKGLPIPEIRRIFQEDYNLKRVKHKDQHTYTINNTGAVYKDGSFIKIDKQMYDLIEKEMKKC